MKKVILSVVMIAFFGVALVAQQATGEKKQKADAMIEQMAADLNLDDTQKVQFEMVMKQSMKQRKELNNKNLSQEEKQHKLKDINKSENSKMNELLTHDQYSKFIELKKEQRETMMKTKEANENQE